MIDKKEKRRMVKELARRVGWTCYCGMKKIALDDPELYRNPEQRQILLMVGDSRTAGGQWYTLDIPLRVENIAIGGTALATNTYEWSSRLAIQAILNYNPRAIMIALGVNDLAAGVHLKKIIGSLCKIYYAVANYTDAEVFIHCGLPVLKHGSAYNSDVIELNTCLRAFCDVHGVRYIDLFYDFMDDKNGIAETRFLNDSEIPAALSHKLYPVHYNDRGYAHWYELLTKYFNKELKHGAGTKAD